MCEEEEGGGEGNKLGEKEGWEKTIGLCEKSWREKRVGEGRERWGTEGREGKGDQMGFGEGRKKFGIRVLGEKKKVV